MLYSLDKYALDLPHFYLMAKSSALVLINPNDEETDMKKLEETVRSIQLAGLFWGACKLVNLLTLSIFF